MNGPEHYREAERLTDQASSWANADMGWKAQLTSEERIAHRVADLAEAQVHATLADAAATAMGAAVEDDVAGLTVEDRDAWFKVAGVKPGKGGPQ